VGWGGLVGGLAGVGGRGGILDVGGNVAVITMGVGEAAWGVVTRAQAMRRIAIKASKVICNLRGMRLSFLCSNGAA
jgi:hypothetical protein